VCRIINTDLFRESNQKRSYPLAELKLGVNEIFDKNALIILSLDKTPVISSNVYKISIQQAIRFDIINERLYVRARKDGDSFVAGGITRKLKKLFSDKKISQDKRDAYPVICDCNGIVLVPGFTVPDRARPQSGESCLYVTYAVRDGR
jgi:tRNA(Ile)-lysidine synthetase-like protein